MSTEFLQKMHNEAVKNLKKLEYKAENLQEFADDYYTKKFKERIDEFFDDEIYKVVKAYAKEGKNIINAQLSLTDSFIGFDDKGELQAFVMSIYTGKRKLEDIDQRVYRIAVQNMKEKEKLGGEKSDSNIVVKASKETIENNIKYLYNKLVDFGFEVMGYKDIKLSDAEYKTVSGDNKFREKKKDITMNLMLVF